jgi:squalene-associated FAD-dependent desaturase
LIRMKPALAPDPSPCNVAIIGAGWAGLAAAIGAVQVGHRITLFEASRTLGGRARGVEVALPSGESVVLDNGQHILLGAYRETLALMRAVGIDPESVLMRLPLDVRFLDGTGFNMGGRSYLNFSPLKVLLGIVQSQGWSAWDKWSLIKASFKWRLADFACASGATVLDVCCCISPRVVTDLIEPLCLSALNTKITEASGAVFLRVLKDALFMSPNADGAAYDMLIPKIDLSNVFPLKAAEWLQTHGAELRLGERVTDLAPLQAKFDQVIVAATPTEAARLLRPIAPDWSAKADALQYRAIATVYAQVSSDFVLPRPMVALHSNANHPAQFVLQRGEAKSLLAFVVSDAEGSKNDIQKRVLSQGEAALGTPLQAVITVVEKRATFACVPNLVRPVSHVLGKLSVVGDYVEGPYPATIEGAVLSTAKILSCHLQRNMSIHAP